MMQELEPDDAKRAVISAELATLPLAYFEEPVPVPNGWAGLPCLYVLLSDAYAAEADTVNHGLTRVIPVRERMADHLIHQQDIRRPLSRPRCANFSVTFRGRVLARCRSPRVLRSCPAISAIA